MQRRSATVGALLAGFALGSEAVAPLPASANIDGIPDLSNLRTGRERYVTKIVAGYNELKTAGTIEDEWLKKKMPKMSKAMDLWGALMRQDLAPDKIMRHCQKNAVAFEKAAKTKDYDATMKAFDAYLEGLPAMGRGGSGKIDFSNPLMPPPN